MPDTFFEENDLAFIWDEDKNEKNIRKHGIDFPTAAMVFRDELRLEYLDPEHSDEEERYRTIGLVRDILTVVYCDRVNEITGSYLIRLISARAATKQEREAYSNVVLGRQ